MNRSMRTVVLAVLLLMLAAGPASAQMITSYWQTASPVVNSARANALGRCEMFGAEGATAMFVNPAWLAGDNGLDVEIGAYGRAGSASSDVFAEDDSYNYDTRIKPGYGAASLGISLGKVITVAAGLGFWTVHEAGWDNTIETSSGFGTQVDTEEYDDAMTAAGIGLAVSMFDQFFVGLSAGGATGNEITSTYTTEVDGNVVSETFFRATPEFSVTTVSFVWEPLELIRAGLMYRPGYDLTLGSMVREVDGMETELDAVTLHQGDVAGLSVSFTPFSWLGVMAEMQTRSYSDAWVKVGDGDETESNVDDGAAVRLGARLGPVHAGVFSESLLFTGNADETQPVDRTGVTLGLGHRGKNGSFHIYVEYATLEYDQTFMSQTFTVEEEHLKFGAAIGLHLF